MSKYPIIVRTLGFLGVLGLAGCAMAPRDKPLQCPNPKVATQKQADASLAWLRTKLPNTDFVSASPSLSAPGLIRVEEVGSEAPLYVNPRTHYLIIGLVVDFGNKSMRIAGGKSLLGAGSLPNQKAGAAQ